MIGTTQQHDSSAVQAACLERLATALSGYPDLEARVRAEGPAPCLAVRNTAVTLMSETVSCDGAAYTWSWGKAFGDASDLDHAAGVIAYVLAAAGARPGC